MTAPVYSRFGGYQPPAEVFGYTPCRRAVRRGNSASRGRAAAHLWGAYELFRVAPCKT